MAKPVFHTKPIAFSRDKTLCFASFVTALIFSCAIWIYTREPSFSSFMSKPKVTQPAQKTFYDDPETHYTIDKPMLDWDRKRSHWLENNPRFKTKNGVMVVTGSQPSPCKHPSGDHYLLRFFKNKVDYCRIHGYQIFYNDAFLEPKMKSFWAKIPVLRAAMLAHPEIEWLFWVDSDAIFTDMDFRVPLERYKDHNLVVHGWPNLIYEKKSWVAVNAGVFLIRNCQWAMEFLDVWAGMGPTSPDYSNWGRVLRETLKDKMFPESDDQSALVYLLLTGDKKWTDKIFVENQYYLHGYWQGLVEKIDEIGKDYLEMEKRVKGLRRRHAEVASKGYAAERVTEGGRRQQSPFVTHFTGCQPCSGNHNLAYEGDSCWVGMERAINFADNQVLRNYGFVRPNVGDNSSIVRPLPFDYPNGQ